jgi:periplasmic protein TonB
MPRDASGKPLFGKVVAEVTISKSGEASRINIFKGDARLRPAVIAVLKQWKWKPFLLNDRPIEVVQTVVVNFEPR